MAKQLPKTEHSLVLRTDFSDDAAWAALCDAIREPQGEDQFRAYVDCLSDCDYDSLTLDQLFALLDGENHLFIFVVDTTAIANPEHPILVIDVDEGPERTFRVIPSEMWGVENNLALANMDFEEFADSVDEDGVFRGFPAS